MTQVYFNEPNRNTSTHQMNVMFFFLMHRHWSGRSRNGVFPQQTLLDKSTHSIYPNVQDLSNKAAYVSFFASNARIDMESNLV